MEEELEIGIIRIEVEKIKFNSLKLLKMLKMMKILWIIISFLLLVSIFSFVLLYLVCFILSKLCSAVGSRQ